MIWLIGIACIAVGIWILFFSDLYGFRKIDREFQDWLKKRESISELNDIEPDNRG